MKTTIDRNLLSISRVLAMNNYLLQRNNETQNHD